MSKILCTICYRVAHRDFGDGLSKGWPACCGHTMELQRVTQDEIKQGVAHAMKPLTWIQNALKGQP